MSYALLGGAFVVIAIAISLIIIKFKLAQQPKQVKIILFGLFFWGLIFLQLAIYALTQSVMK